MNTSAAYSIIVTTTTTGFNDSKKTVYFQSLAKRLTFYEVINLFRLMLKACKQKLVTETYLHATP